MRFGDSNDDDDAPSEEASLKFDNPSWSIPVYSISHKKPPARLSAAQQPRIISERNARKQELANRAVDIALQSAELLIKQKHEERRARFRAQEEQRNILRQQIAEARRVEEQRQANVKKSLEKLIVVTHSNPRPLQQTQQPSPLRHVSPPRASSALRAPIQPRAATPTLSSTPLISLGVHSSPASTATKRALVSPSPEPYGSELDSSPPVTFVASAFRRPITPPTTRRGDHLVGIQSASRNRNSRSVDHQQRWQEENNTPAPITVSPSNNRTANRVSYTFDSEAAQMLRHSIAMHEQSVQRQKQLDGMFALTQQQQQQPRRRRTLFF